MVKEPERREHNDYFENDDWTVVDVKSPDKFFVTNMADGEVRIDFDAFGASTKGMQEEGERVNISLWLEAIDMVELYEALGERLEEKAEANA